MDEPLIRWDWIARNLEPTILPLLWDNVVMALVPVLVGLIIALPAGLACVRWPWLYQPVASVANVVYSLPSLALFAVLLGYVELKSRMIVMIPLAAYALALLIPAVVDGLRAVDEPVRQAATAMGFGPLRRLLKVDLPIAVPVVLAGTRVATVSSISLVSVGAIVGKGGLGDLFIQGWRESFYTPIIVGVVLVIAMAVLADAVLVVAQRLLTPWARARRVP